MLLLHHYLQRGFTIEYLLNLDIAEKHFMMASMSLYFEDEKAKRETA